jgi:fructosamine-3-kinase
MTSLAGAGAALLGAGLLRSAPLGGGCLSEIAHIHLADGREAIVKGGPAPEAEAAMLQAIAASGAPAPAVLAANSEVLVLEIMPAGGSLSAAWEDLGAVAARLHSAQGQSYGWPQDYTFGAVSIPNARADNWPQFWAARRLLPHCPHIAPALARRVEALAKGLAARLPAQPPPALLHGDLWGGNVLSAGSRVTALIDPACYYGHAEVDLAMLEMFDAPPPAFYEAYGRLEAGYRERLVIYRLWPALVHLRLFGSSYAPLVLRLLQEAGA